MTLKFAKGTGFCGKDKFISRELLQPGASHPYILQSNFLPLELIFHGNFAEAYLAKYNELRQSD